MTLGAFERKDGSYNVWRYDTGKTINILWGVKADSRKHAEQLAKEKIENEIEVNNPITSEQIDEMGEHYGEK